MSKDCKIVEDLLPNYMEHLTNDETNNFIEEHLSNCKNCEKTFNSMKENIDSKKIEETKDIDFLKKFSRRFKIVRGILVIILLIFVVIIGRRTIILSNINSKFNKVTTANSDNFYMKSTTYTENQALIVETYNKSDKYLTKTSLWDNGELVTKLTYYKDKDEKIGLVDNKERKYRNDNLVGGLRYPETTTSSFISNLQYAFQIGISKTKIDDEECYVIRNGKLEYFISKESGLTLKEISLTNNSVTDYKYEFGSVKDTDIIKPTL